MFVESTVFPVPPLGEKTVITRPDRARSAIAIRHGSRPGLTGLAHRERDRLDALRQEHDVVDAGRERRLDDAPARRR